MCVCVCVILFILSPFFLSVFLLFYNPKTILFFTRRALTSEYDFLMNPGISVETSFAHFSSNASWQIDVVNKYSPSFVHSSSSNILCCCRYAFCNLNSALLAHNNENRVCVCICKHCGIFIKGVIFSMTLTWFI